MVAFRFFVHCSGWRDGGYENVHPAGDEKEVMERIAFWNSTKPDNPVDLH